MKKWINDYNLEIMTVILAIVFLVSIFFWDGLTLAGKAVLGFMVLYALHEWEESKFPGGFYDLFFGGFGIEIKVSEARMHLPVAIYILIMLLIPFALQKITFLILIPLGLGLFEGVIHVAGIIIHKLKKPYTPGMITGIIMFAYSIFLIVQINNAGGLPVWQWIVGFVLALIGFLIMEQFFLKTVGLTFVDFRKMAMARVLGDRNFEVDGEVLIMECKQFSLQKNGFKGTFYEGSNNKDKVVIYLGGAFLNEKITNDSSEFLRNAGYSVMVVGFYLWDGLPKEMYHIPVEYVENAIEWLKNNGYHRIGIMGTSTGAGYALLCASLLSDINCVIAVSPLDYVMEGVKGKLNPQNCSVYQYKGKDIPYTEFNVLHGNLRKEFGKFFKNIEYDNKHMNRYAYDMAEYTEESRIKVEHMKADILMMAPRYDDSWPSTEAVNRMEIILKNCNYPYRVRKIIYENGSHALGYWKLDKKFKFLMKYMYSIEKNNPLECEKVREESTEAILDFIREW